MPDYYRGTFCDFGKVDMEGVGNFIKGTTKWETNLKVDWEKKIKPYAQKHGAETFGAIGKSQTLEDIISMI
jgi:hypothetical protein